MDPDKLASQKTADLDLHCFIDRICLSLAWKGLTLSFARSDFFLAPDNLFEQFGPRILYLKRVQTV